MNPGVERCVSRHALVWAIALVGIVHWGCTPSIDERAWSRSPFAGSTEILGLQTEILGLQAACEPRFPDSAGWRGADAAYSVVLPDPSATLWLFGDTFVDRPGQPGDRDYPFIHNSVGVSRCDGEGKWTLETFWDRRDASHPSAFFTPDPESDWVRETRARTGRDPYYWLFGGFMFEDVLFVGLLRVAHSDPRGPFQLPFDLVGMDLARIENPRDPPGAWRVQKSVLSNDRRAFPGAAFVVARDFLYAFAFHPSENDTSPRFLTRLPLERLTDHEDDLSPYLETLVRNDTWQPGFAPDRARILMSDDATEMSVHYDPEIGTWIAVYVSPRPPNRPAGPSYVQLRRASRLEGPWSPPQDVLPIPETRSGSEESRRENLFCYAAKAHPQFAESGRLLITYVCNLYARSEDEAGVVLEQLRHSPELYRPKTLSIAIPEAPR